MPWTVRVRNFQSIEDATVVIDGFVVITGPNNSGKTAFMRAVRGVFTNAPAGPLVRRGATHLTVDIDMGDGNAVRWEKGDKINQYHLNGKKLENVGRGCPPEVLALGVQPIRAGSDLLWPQMAEQFRVLFLIGSPGSAMAEAVADVERVGKLTSALKLAESDRRTSTSKLSVRKSDETTLVTQLAEFETLDRVETLVSQVETQTAEVSRIEGAMAPLAGLRARKNAYTEVVASLAGIAGVGVPTSHQVTYVRDLCEVLTDNIRVRGLLRRSEAEVVSLTGVESVVVPEPAAAIAVRSAWVAWSDASRIREALRKHRTDVEVFSGVSGINLPESTEVQKLRVTVAEHTLLANRLRLARVREQQAIEAEQAASTHQIPSTAVAEKMRLALKRLREIQGRRNTAVSSVQDSEEELGSILDSHTETSAEVDVLLAGMEECPTCGRVMDQHDHVLGVA